MTEYTNQRSCSSLLLLTGSNPLPNYIAAHILKPQKICLFYTSETENVKNNLMQQLKKALPNVSIEEKAIEDATHGEKVQHATRAKQQFRSNTIHPGFFACLPWL